LDLEGAAGVGRLDIVKSFVDEDGSLRDGATEAQRNAGFIWACEYGRTDVAEFLLERGVPADLKHRGETGLHWAAYAGHPDIVQLLLAQNAPIDAGDDRFDGTPLGWALYGWGNLPPGTNRDEYYEVVEGLVRAGAPVDPAWMEKNADRRRAGDKIRADPRMLAALGGAGPRPRG
jgi:ankyrin repeat protein